MTNCNHRADQKSDAIANWRGGYDMLIAGRVFKKAIQKWELIGDNGEEIGVMKGTNWSASCVIVLSGNNGKVCILFDKQIECSEPHYMCYMVGEPTKLWKKQQRDYLQAGQERSITYAADNTRLLERSWIQYSVLKVSSLNEY